MLPRKIQDEVKGLLRKGEGDFTDKNAYKLLKHEVLRIFGPKPEAGIERAMKRVLSGLPSQLARVLVDDICKCDVQLQCTCCPSIVSYLWKRQLPTQVLAGIAEKEFNKDNFNAIIELADKIFNNTNTAKAFAVNAVTAQNLDETQPAISYPIPEVSAVRGASGRSRGRGGRGRGGRGRGAQAQAQPRHRGTKHPDLPAGEWKGCGMHFKFGKGAFFCSDPSSCPWKDIYCAKPTKQ